jgi:hypothetical protein
MPLPWAWVSFSRAGCVDPKNWGVRLQGMIMGPKTAVSMLIGAILGKLCFSEQHVASALHSPCYKKVILSIYNPCTCQVSAFWGRTHALRVGLQAPSAAGARAPQGGSSLHSMKTCPPPLHTLHADADACLIALAAGGCCG